MHAGVASSAAREPLRFGAASMIVAAALVVSGCSVGDTTAGSAGTSTPLPQSSGGAATTGDAELLAAVGGTFGDDVDRAAVALVIDDEVRTAFVNADASTMFEFGSITKALTGLLLAEAVRRGEVAVDDPVGDFLELGTSDAASATLERLATHRAGMPVVPDAPTDDDPFPDEPGALVAQAMTVEVPDDADFSYDNVGPALLGQALAGAAGTEYSQLLRERVLDPASMDGAVVVGTDAEVPDDLQPGYTLAQIPVEPWTFGDYAPAAGVAGTLDDVVGLARSVISGPFADSAALDPVYEINTRFAIGYLWFVESRSARTVTGHSGQTGGYSSVLFVDRGADVASIVLWDAPGDAEEVALRLLLLAD
ncbi:serine hydrolase domain-containing protein [Agromyces sp. SYSU T00266]|uniref:serine hydrolase domain-containing protein n=1 Tax=Agromyces zhanjiangensis TaxID=3158562 RepID=UPI00339478EF